MLPTKFFGRSSQQSKSWGLVPLMCILKRWENRQVNVTGINSVPSTATQVAPIGVAPAIPMNSRRSRSETYQPLSRVSTTASEMRAPHENQPRSLVCSVFFTLDSAVRWILILICRLGGLSKNSLLVLKVRMIWIRVLKPYPSIVNLWLQCLLDMYGDQLILGRGLRQYV